MFRKMMLLTTLTIVVVLLAGCGANFGINLFTADETVSQSFTAAQTPHIVVQMFNGGIDVVTGSDNTIRVDVTKRGGGNSQQAAQDDLKNVEVTMTQEGDTIRVVAQRTDRRVDIGNSGASARLRVPSGSTLDLRTSNSGITTSGPTGDAKVDTSNGGIDVRGALGQLNLTTSNGGISVNGGSGYLQMETSNGSINITADNVTVNGDTSNGPINFTGSLAQGHSVMRTSNGSIVVTLPANATFAINADTSNGKVSSDFPVTGADQGDTYLRGTVGTDPGATLELHTSNGPIEIQQSRR